MDFNVSTTVLCLSWELMLTHWGRMMHICISKLTIIGSNDLACGFLPSHYLNQCCNIFNSNGRNNLWCYLQKNSYIFIQENAFENVVCKVAAILFQLQCVKLTSSCRHEDPGIHSNSIGNKFHLICLVSRYLCINLWISLFSINKPQRLVWCDLITP